MKIAGKISLIYAVLALAVCLLVALWSGQRALDAALDSQRAKADALIQQRPDIPIDLYQRDESRLQSSLQALSRSAGLDSAAFYDSKGARLAQSPIEGRAATELGADANSLSDTRILALSSDRSTSTPALLAVLLGQVDALQVTTPVWSVFNPAQRNLRVQDFMNAIARPKAGQAKSIMGYLQSEQSGAELTAQLRAHLLPLLGALIALLAVGGWVVRTLLNRAHAPLTALRHAAEQVDAGHEVEPLPVQGSGELVEVVSVFNRLVDNLTDYKKALDVDKQMLTRKVDESASKLSQRDEELSRATEEISLANERLHKMAYYDSLTALPNRTLFAEQLRLLVSLSVRNRKPLALMFLRLNQFKRINDSLGRRAADALLTEVAKRLTGCLRSSDMLGHYSASGPRIDVSRLGGDEFSLVLNELEGPESAQLVAERVMGALADPIEIEGHELVVTPSIGIALAPVHGEDVDVLMRAAASAMHHARTTLQGGYSLYQPSMDAGELDQIRLEAELRKAIDRDQLQLHYQPQVNTGDGSIVAAEALLRWEHPEYGQVPPFRFIAIAQEIGLMDALGDWVVAEACRQMARYRDKGLELPRVVINVARIQFGPRFTQSLKQVLEQWQLPPASIELGLSEEILVENNTDTINALRELAELGVYLSIDNFGTTHAPLSYISQYPFNELRIDRSFVSDCDHRMANASLVRAIIALAQSLELNYVAEGVETQKEYQFLADAGVRAMQGFLFSKPVPADELQKLLEVPWCFMPQIQQMKLANASKDEHPL